MPKCKNCKQKFTPVSFNRKYCIDNECNDIYYEELKQQMYKSWNKEKKVKKENLKTKKDYEKELEVIFNKFIRLRDKDKPCISCDSTAGTYTLTAGHFHPAGTYKNLRFNEDNVHGQCWYNCNKNKHGNLLEYRIRLVEKIGVKAVEELDRLRNEDRRFTIPELIEMKIKYKDLVKKLEG